MHAIETLAGLALGIWVYLLWGRGKFWKTSFALDGKPGHLEAWPPVIAIVPARNEEEMIGRSLPALLAQDYPGAFSVLLVDDHSGDKTLEQAEEAARHAGGAERFTAMRVGPLPGGWSGKLWALSEGLSRAAALGPPPKFVWFTDADIVHDRSNLRRLAAKAEKDELDLVSWMVTLHCGHLWERLLIPAFVFFFQKLYPFSWVNSPERSTAAAAGGCMLVRSEALRRAGGLAPIRGEAIDDCALARLIQKEGRAGGGRLWLGLSRRAQSVRPYPRLAGIWNMVRRNAFTQLKHSYGLLAGTLLGMAAAYLAPPAAALAYPWHVSEAAGLAGLLAWALMARAATPTLRLYGQSPAAGLLLPIAGLLYAGMTLHSALDHALGRGSGWKGRPGLRPER